MVTSLVAFVIAGVVAFVITPPVRRLAERFNVIDKPDRRRKRHRRLIPLWGGIAIFFSGLLGFWLALHFTESGQVLYTYRGGLFAGRLYFVLAAVCVLLCIGLVDDCQPLPPKVKLLAQISAAGLVVIAGFWMQNLFSKLSVPIWQVLGVCLAILWLVLAINAFNFIDGLDGLASSQAVISGGTLCLGALLLARHSQDLITTHQYALASLIAAAVAGAALGFWRYNHFPAKIFLGDGGSNVLGFSLSFSALLLMDRAASIWTFVFVLLALGWPLFDTVQVILRRLRRGDPISKADNRHLHHFLVGRGFTHASAVAIINLIVLILCSAGLVVTWL